jgi:hypothetical protein
MTHENNARVNEMIMTVILFIVSYDKENQTSVQNMISQCVGWQLHEDGHERSSKVGRHKKSEKFDEQL